MKIKNLIVSGCSFTAGCGFFKTELSPDPEDNNKRKIDFAHKGLEKYFKEPFTNYDLKQQVEKMMYPSILGEKLNIKNVKNLAVGGMGHPIHTRRIFSYLLNNQDKINFNETLVLLQLTSLQRAELPIPKKDNVIHYCHIADGDGDKTASNYLINHYNPYYLILKGLYELSLFKGWCESMGIKIIFLDILGKVGFWKGEETRMGQTPTTINNHQYAMYHDYIRYPSIKDITSMMDVITINTKGYKFSDNGYHDDAHFAPEAHEDIAEKIINELKENFKFNLDI
jgi:hypothetical protein